MSMILDALRRAGGGSQPPQPPKVSFFRRLLTRYYEWKSRREARKQQTAAAASRRVTLNLNAPPPPPRPLAAPAASMPSGTSRGFLRSISGHAGWGLAAALIILVVYLAVMRDDEKEPSKEDTTAAAPATAAQAPVATQVSTPQPEACQTLPAAETTLTVTATKEWSRKFCFPPAMIVDWRATNPNGRFKMKTQFGEYSFTPETSNEVKGIVAEASFMTLGENPEEIRIRLHR